MATMLFKLTGVPDDEADDVRELLAEQGFETYETQAGRWQISVAAIWLVNDDDLPRARTVLDDYQQRRADAARQAYQDRVSRGEHNTLGRNLARNPLQVISYTLIGLLVLGLSTVPFFRLML